MIVGAVSVAHPRCFHHIFILVLTHSMRHTAALQRDNNATRAYYSAQQPLPALRGGAAPVAPVAAPGRNAAHLHATVLLFVYLKG